MQVHQVPYWFGSIKGVLRMTHWILSKGPCAVVTLLLVMLVQLMVQLMQELMLELLVVVVVSTMESQPRALMPSIP